MKIDITNTVTEIKVVLMVLEIPLKSQSPHTDLIHPNVRQIFANGSINESKNVSIKLINSRVDAFITTAPEVCPPSSIVAVIIGAKEVIILHSALIYSSVLFPN